MAKEEKEEPKKPEGDKKEGGGGKKKLHLHEIRSVQAKDGSVVHHHTYKDHVDSPMSHPERGPMATSSDPAEAGQHVEEQFGQNQMGAAAPAAAAGGGASPDPAADGGGAAPMAGA